MSNAKGGVSGRTDNARTTWSGALSAYSAIYPHAESPTPGFVVATGLPSLDKVLGGGFRTGELIALGGDAGSGTSSLALSFALNARGIETVYFTSEASADRVVERALASESRSTLVSMRQWPMDDDVEARVSAAATRLSALALNVVSMQSDGVRGIRDALNSGVQLVLVDGLESLVTSAESRDDQLSLAVLELKRMAVELQTVVVLVCHVSSAEADRRPGLADFGARGAIATHADTVLGLFREDMYLDRFQADASVHGAAELILLKRREGGLGYVDLFFHSQWLRFEDVLDPES